MMTLGYTLGANSHSMGLGANSHSMGLGATSHSFGLGQAISHGMGLGAHTHSMGLGLGADFLKSWWMVAAVAGAGLGAFWYMKERKDKSRTIAGFGRYHRARSR